MLCQLFQQRQELARAGISKQGLFFVAVVAAVFIKLEHANSKQSRKPSRLIKHHEAQREAPYKSTGKSI